MSRITRLNQSQRVVIVIAAAVIIFAIVVVLSAFYGAASAPVEQKEQNPYFEEVYSTPAYKVVYDKETYVMYTLSNGHNNKGSFTMLVENDGTPKIYKGE